jgi:hypothetical protein
VGDLVVPSAEQLVPLQQAMAFSLDDLRHLLPCGDPGALELLIVDAGSVRFTDTDLRHGTADRRPLLRAGDWLVLARPFGLLSAVTHRLALVAADAAGPRALAELFGDSVDDDVADALRHMRLRPEITQRRGRTQPFTEIRARCDTDKVVVALVLADDFEALSEDHPYGQFQARQWLEPMHEHLEAVAEAAPPGEEILGIIVVQSAGRGAGVATRRPRADNLTLKTLSAADLDVIGFLEANDQLALWKFAKESAAVAAARTVMFSPLDGYGAYRDAERSLAAFRSATMVFITPGTGADRRWEARSARDRHGRPGVDGRVREVERTDVDEALKGDLYRCVSCLWERRMTRFVEGAPIGLWATGPQGELELSWDAVDAVAYWLGELREPMRELLAALAARLDCLEFEVRIADRDHWLGVGRDPGGDDAGHMDVAGPAQARITLGPAMRRVLPRADNTGERLLVGFLVHALDALARQNGLAGVAPADRGAIIDAAAPLGVKKHLLFLPVDANPMMEQADDRPRTVHEADLTAARLALADHLRDQFGYRNEQIPYERRNELLQSSVAFLFDASRGVIDAASPQGVLEQLMTANERLIADSEHRRTILPAREATYPASAAELRDEVARGNQASVCCRFLVEYAAAQPPHGDARWSTARYDEALALVSLLLDWGNLSDAVYGGLTTMGLLVRDDGQLRVVEYDRYESGRGVFFGACVDRERERSHERFAERFATDPGDTSSELLQRLDPAVESEAGVTLSELGELLVAANLVARERDVEVVVLPRSEAIAELADAVERPAARVEAGIAFLTLGPRAEFLQPPTGHRRDTYPWLFARRWSYNRRPFVLRERKDGVELLWGRRHVVQAMQILIGQMTSGRFQALAETATLRAELGRLAHEKGVTFEREVAALLREEDWLEVAISVRRLGDDRLGRSRGEPLGDIDVLAADRRTRIIWAIECKDLSGAVTAAEITREMSDHFRNGGSTSVTKHSERVDWLRERIPGALERLGIQGEPEEGWSVHGLLVTGRAVIAPYIDDVPFDVIPISGLLEHLARARPS